MIFNMRNLTLVSKVFFGMLITLIITYQLMPPFFTAYWLKLTLTESISAIFFFSTSACMIWYLFFLGEAVFIIFNSYKRIGDTDYFYKITKDIVDIRLNDIFFSKYEYNGTGDFGFLHSDFDENKIDKYTKIPIFYIKTKTTTTDINKYLNYFIELDKCIKDDIQKKNEEEEQKKRQSKYLNEELKNFKI
jgi:hypothetical protein